MKIKKFKARSFSEALKLVKDDLGSEAVILSSKEFKGLKPSVEVLAAVDYEAELKKHRPEKITEWIDGSIRRKKETGQAAQVEPPTFGVHYRNALQGMPDGDPLSEDLQLKIKTIRDKIGTIVRSEQNSHLSAAGKSMYQFLREQAVYDDLAVSLCRKAAHDDDVETAMADNITVRSDLVNKAVMLIGSTGVGKTTTIAKLAAREIRKGRRAAIISLDTYRIGAVEQMRIYCRIMGIPLAAASNAAELKQAYGAFSRDRDFIFIDTIGRNPRDEQYISQLREIARMDIPLEVHLLVSANSDEGFIRDAVSRYSRVPISCIGITKADEAVRYGLIYNLVATHAKPVSYVTTGQKVPDDIVFPSPRHLSQMIMRKRSVHA